MGYDTRMFQRIMIGYDFTPEGTQALRCGLALAARFRARAEVVHVAAGASGDDEELRQRIGQHCDAAIASLPNLDGLHVTYRVQIRFGTTAQELSDAAADHGANLLIIGSKPVERMHMGLSSTLPRQLGLGSVAGRLVRIPSNTPLLLHRSDFANLINRLLVAVNLDAASEHVLSSSFDLAREFMSDLIIQHVMPGSGHSGLGLGMLSMRNAWEQYRDETKAAFTDYLEKMAATARNYPYDPVFSHGDPAERIVATARRIKVDMLVLGWREPRGIGEMFLGTVAEQVALASPANVLLLPLFVPKERRVTESAPRPVTG